MNREIKFRAWDKEQKNMIVHEQKFIPVKVTNHGVMRLNPHHKENFWEFIDSERFIIEQFTGLKDKNGVEIYEGDILRFFSRDFKNDVEKYEMEENRWTFLVEYKNGCCGYSPAMPSMHHVDDLCFSIFFHEQDDEMKDMSDIEIIGNIHENPELLEVKP